MYSYKITGLKSGSDVVRWEESVAYQLQQRQHYNMWYNVWAYFINRIKQKEQAYKT